MIVEFNGERIQFPDDMSEAEIAKVLAAEAARLDAEKRAELAESIRQALDLDTYADKMGQQADTLEQTIAGLSDALGEKADEIKAILERPLVFPEFPDQLTVDMPDRWDEVLDAIRAIDFPAPVVTVDAPGIDTQPIIDAIQQIRMGAVDLEPLAEVMRSVKMSIDNIPKPEPTREPKGFRINPTRPDGARIVDLIY